MPDLTEIQGQHPEYKDLSPEQFADKLYSKFYSDMPRAEFDKKLNVKKQSGEISPVREARKTLSSINEHAIADTLGMPVDLVNAGLKKIGVPTSEKPFLGSESIKSGMRAMNMSEEGAEPETMPGKAVAAIGGGAVEAALTGGGVGGLMKAGGEALGSTALKAAGKIMAAPGPNIAAGGGGAAGGKLAKEATEGTSFERPAEIAGEFVGGALTGLPASATLRGLREANPVLSAYERLKLAPSAAEAGVGGKSAQWLEGNVLPQTLGGGSVMERFKQKRLRELTEIQQSIADQYGGPKPRAEMGKSVQDSVMDTWLKVKDIDGRIIGGLKQKYGPDVVYPTHLIEAVTSPIGAASTKEVREATLDPLIQETAAMIRASGGHFTFDDLAALKTKYGAANEPGYQKNVNDAQVSQLYNAVRKDMEQHIKVKAPEEFKQLQEANKRYATAQDDFKKYFRKLIGSKNVPVSSERAYEIVTGATTEKGRGDLEEFKHVWDALPPEERGNLAATVFSRLGAIDKSNPGSVDTWSLGKFLSGYREISPEAKKMLFKGRNDVAQSIDDLVDVVENINQKIHSLQSTSKSGVGSIMLGQFGLGQAISHLTQGDILHGVAYSMGGPWLAAQVLTNPTAVKALAASMRRLDASLDAGSRAVIDLNTVPKLPQLRPMQNAKPAAAPAAPSVPISQ